MNYEMIKMEFKTKTTKKKIKDTTFQEIYEYVWQNDVGFAFDTLIDMICNYVPSGIYIGYNEEREEERSKRLEKRWQQVKTLINEEWLEKEIEIKEIFLKQEKESD